MRYQKCRPSWRCWQAEVDVWQCFVTSRGRNTALQEWRSLRDALSGLEAGLDSPGTSTRVSTQNEAVLDKPMTVLVRMRVVALGNQNRSTELIVE
jgi:hypothetical protein